MVKWAMYGAAGLFGVIGAIALVGMTLPQGHRAQRRASIRRPPGEVFAAISDFERHPEWRHDVRRVTVQGTGLGAVVREESDGETITFKIEAFDPPSRLVMRIADDSLPFGGTWSYDLQPSATGTEITITEDGEIHNPIFRFLARFVFGHDGTIDRYLSDLQQRR